MAKVEIRSLLDEIGKAGTEDNGLLVSDLLKKLGQNIFGPLMLIPALFIISPFSAIVSFDSVMGILVALVAVWMLFGRKRTRCQKDPQIEDRPG